MHPRVSASLRRRLVARCNRRVTDQRQNDDSRSAPLPQRCGTMYRGLIRRSSDMRSSNPVLRDKTFSGQHAEGEVMTMDGMVGKTGILFVLLLIAAGWTWKRFYDVLAEAGPQAAMGAVSP